MVYLRGGAVVTQESTLDRVLSFPMRVYEFLMFFFMTLIDVRRGPAGSHTSFLCSFSPAAPHSSFFFFPV